MFCETRSNHKQLHQETRQTEAKSSKFVNLILSFPFSWSALVSNHHLELALSVSVVQLRAQKNIGCFVT